MLYPKRTAALFFGKRLLPLRYFAPSCEEGNRLNAPLPFHDLVLHLNCIAKLLLKNYLSSAKKTTFDKKHRLSKKKGL